jgi:hypothetical protein
MAFAAIAASRAEPPRARTSAPTSVAAWWGVAIAAPDVVGVVKADEEEGEGESDDTDGTLGGWFHYPTKGSQTDERCPT